MTPISFTARYIRPADIKKFDGSSYRPHVASLVEMERSDCPVIERVAYDWMQPVSDQLAKESQYIGKDGIHVYAVTNQTNHFEQLESNKIVGMMLFQEGGPFKTHNTIEFLQVSPNEMSPNYGSGLSKKFNKLLAKIFKFKPPEHKHIGKALLDTAKEMSADKPIDLYSVEDAVEFYLINGFKNLKGFKNCFLNHMEWKG